MPDCHDKNSHTVRARDLVGLSNDGDGELELDLAIFKKQNGSKKCALSKILEGDYEGSFDFERLAAVYTKLDQTAVSAKNWYHGVLASLGILSIVLLALIAWLILTPNDYLEFVKFPIYIMIAGVVAWLIVYLLELAWHLLSRVTDAVAFDFSLFVTQSTVRSDEVLPKSAAKKVGREKHTLIVRLIAFPIVGLVLLFWLVNFDPLQNKFTGHNFLLLLLALLGVTLLFIDAVTGGYPARVLGARSMRDIFFGRRSRAEYIRRYFFKRLISEGNKRDAPASEPSLNSQILEFIRRFHVNVQLKLYDKNDPARSRHWQQLSLGFVVVALFMVIFIPWLMASGEQTKGTGGWFGDWTAYLSNYLIDWHMRGYDQVLVLSILGALGFLLFARAADVFHDRDRHRKRNAVTASRLRHASAHNPDEFDPHSALSSARTDAANGSSSKLENLCDNINVILASELYEGSSIMSYEIDRVGPLNLPRLISIDKISPTVFKEISERLGEHGYPLFRAVKTGFVSAVQVPEGGEELVVTNYDHVETKKTAVPTDWIVANMHKSFIGSQVGDANLDRHLIQDDAGNYDRYIIKAEKFKKLYERTEQHHTTQGDVYKARVSNVSIEVIELRGGFDIVAPWDERQRRSKGFLVLKDGEVYGIYEPIFDKTYNRV